MEQITRLTKLGIILLAIAISFLVSSFYRSCSTESFSYGLIGFAPMQPYSWNFNPNTTISENYIWSPRTLRMDVKANSSIDLYILDERGLRLWTLEGILEAVWAFKGIKQEILTLQINKRDKYAFLIHNPTNSSVDYEINCTLYGFETDLLWASILFMSAGLLTTGTSILYNHKKWQT